MALARDSAGNSLIVGRATNGSALDDILVMKLSTLDGSILWTRLIDGAEHGNDRGWDIVVDPNDNPVITGITSNADESANFTTVKLDKTDGHVLWNRTLPGASNNLSEPVGWLAACDNGDVVLVSRTWTPATSYDVILQRYSGFDGHTIWEAQYGSVGTRADEPRAMSRDLSGNILVAGGTAGDYMVLKYDAANGTRLWAASYDGPAHGYDGADCVMPGPNGEVVVSGFLTGQTTSWDAGTAAFSSADGALLWGTSFDAGDGQSDEGRALAVSPLGDLYVAGYGYRLATDGDILSLRYQVETTGAPDAAGAPLSLASAAIVAQPNPFSSFVRLTFSPEAADGSRGKELRIFDTRGALVRSLHPQAATGFPVGSVVWDGRDQRGHPVAPGVYWAITGAGTGAAGRLVRAR